MRNKIIYITIITTLAFIALVARAQTSPDAIAIRIMQNPNHYSALRWYQEKHFSGSPQSIVVDGYNGIRDGRTVYVNAANIVNGKLYTNIYLISYNQSAENATVDIFGKMVEHWKFNSNITDPEEKARVVRDTIRLEGLNDIKYLLSQYKATKGHYPELNSGSYIKNVSISAWPSWQEVFAKELKVKLPEDETNKLGICDSSHNPNYNYNPKTCWDEKQRKFADANPNDPQLNLPAGSSVFVYQTDSKGLAYDLCAAMESTYTQGTGSGSCGGSVSGGNSNNYQVTESRDNHGPKFIGFDLPTINSGLEFTGYIKAMDPDNDDIIWTFDFQPDFATANQWDSWGNHLQPAVSNSPNKNEKKITAPKTGKKGKYTFKVSISDGKASSTKIFDINVVNDGPVVMATDREYIASTTNPFKTAFEVYDLISDYPLGYSTSMMMDELAKWISTKIEFVHIDLLNQASKYQFSLSGILATSTVNVNGSNHVFLIDFGDQYGATTTNKFNVKVINNQPAITTPLNCLQITRQNSPGHNNSYQTCQIRATDPDGNLINKFELIQTTPGISIDNYGLITGNPSIVGDHLISIIAKDEYGAVSDEKSYHLHVNDYCGDGTRQSGDPIGNHEGKGGINNDGREQCDGTDNVALTPDDSNQYRQYACTGGCSSIIDNCANTCVATGGYCGDGILQNGTNGTLNREQCDSNITDVKKKCEGLKGYDIKDSDGTELDCGTVSNNIIGASGISAMYGSMCDNCKFPSSGACFDNKSYLGLGCYEGQTNPNDPSTGTGCKKGAYICENNQFVCGMNVFDPPKFDYCCNNEANKIKNNQIGTFNIVRAIPADLVVPSFTGVYSNVGTTFNYYTCDGVCKNVGKICVGVGLNDHASNACISVVHDVGCGGATPCCSCSLGVNQYKDDCRSKFSLAGASTAVNLAAPSIGQAQNWVFGYLGTCTDCPSVAGLSSNYHVGETACYCQ